MKFVMLVALPIIAILIVFIVYVGGYNDGCKNNNLWKDTVEKYKTLLEQQNNDWKKAYTDMQREWLEKYKAKSEYYERQIKILEQMLEKENKNDKL